MLRFTDLKVHHKLLLLVLTFTAGLLTLSATALHTMNQVKVNGPIYARVSQGKDLVADILPPPEYIIELYLTAHQMGVETDHATLDTLIQRCTVLEADYQSRHEYWAKLLPEGEIRQALIDNSYQSAQAFFQALKTEYIPAIQAGDRARAASLLEGKLKTSYEAHRAQIDRVVTLTNSQNDRTETEAAAYIHSRLLQLLIIASAVLVAVLALGWFIGRGIARPLRAIIEPIQRMAAGDLTVRVSGGGRDEVGQVTEALGQLAVQMNQAIGKVARTADEVADAAAEIAANAEEASQGIQEQNDQMAQISVGVEQMAASIHEVAGQSTATADSARRASHEAQTGGEVVGRTIAGIQAIASFVREAGDRMSELGERSGQIGQVIQVIDDIAEQTNLLALNAAIEAARAGEHGRGFAVVADEVRKLADRTTHATREISDSIKNIQSQTATAVERMSQGTVTVDDGVRQAEGAGVALSSILTDLNEMTRMVQSIAAATEQQSATSEHIARGITSITAVSQQTSAGASQSAEAAMQLAAKAGVLHELVGRFQIEPATR